MPTYDYQCEGCGHAFEEFQSMSDKPLKKCPRCKKAKLRRLFGTGAAIIFKGAGFYQTDYRSDSYKKAAEKDKPATDSKGAKKSESKSTGEAAKPAESGKAKKKSSPKKD